MNVGWTIINITVGDVGYLGVGCVDFCALFLDEDRLEGLRATMSIRRKHYTYNCSFKKIRLQVSRETCIVNANTVQNPIEAMIGKP